MKIKQKNKKRITRIIQDMIDMVLQEGRQPKELRLTQEDYDKLVKETKSFNKPGYYKKPYGVIYYSKPQPKLIEKFLGLPVHIDYFTKVLW